jgi:hypothetical protein
VRRISGSGRGFHRCSAPRRRALGLAGISESPGQLASHIPRPRPGTVYCYQHNKLCSKCKVHLQFPHTTRFRNVVAKVNCQVRAQSQPPRRTAGEPAQTDVKAPRGPADWAMMRARLTSLLISARPALPTTLACGPSFLAGWLRLAWNYFHPVDAGRRKTVPLLPTAATAAHRTASMQDKPGCCCFDGSTLAHRSKSGSFEFAYNVFAPVESVSMSLLPPHRIHSTLTRAIIPP